MGCVACAIAQKELEASVLTETEHVIAFLDHEPINPGHILVCPRAHYANLIDVPTEILQEIHALSKLVYAAIKACYEPDGISLMNNNGVFNDLGHYHLHVFPRYKGDGFGWTMRSTGIVDRSVLEAELKRLSSYV